MVRPLRIEFAGATYHVTSRGDRGEAIYRDDLDRKAHLDLLGTAAARFDVSVAAYCLMSNHYHLVVHTRQANLSAFMRHVNGVYSQSFNRRHDLVGHVFQGRFHGIVVDVEAYFLEVVRYVELNPVRAGMVRTPAQWPWSSYLAHGGHAEVPEWLDADLVAGALLSRPQACTADRVEAAQRHRAHVLAGMGCDLWGTSLRQQIYLGGPEFIGRMQALAKVPSATPLPKADRKGTARLHRSMPLSAQDWLRQYADPAVAVYMAHTHGLLTMTEIARSLGKSVNWVSKKVRKVEAERVEQRVRTGSEGG